MRWRAGVAHGLAVAALAGCGAIGGGGTGGYGDMHVERVLPGRTSTLLDEPAFATYCAGDSLLTIVAVGGGGEAGLAVRAAIPLRTARTFTVEAALADTSSATAAVRLRTGSARVGISGTVRLQVGSRISGDFDVALPDSAGTHPRLKGRLSRIPVRDGSPATCGGV